MDELLQFGDKSSVAIRREANHLELVAVFRETEILRDRQIQQAQRVWKEDATVDRESGTLDTTPRRADEVSEAVDRAHRRGVERTDKRGTGEVRRMVLDEPES